MYIISLTYKVDTETVDKYLNDHVEYLKEQYSLGNFLASGRKVPRTGGIILSNINNLNTLEEVLKADPFNKNEIADYNITEFIPSMTCKDLNFLIAK